MSAPHASPTLARLGRPFPLFFFFFKSAWNYASMQDGEKGIKPNGMTSCDVSEFSFSFGGFSAKKKKKIR